MPPPLYLTQQTPPFPPPPPLTLRFPNPAPKPSPAPNPCGSPQALTSAGLTESVQRSTEAKLLEATALT